LESFAAIPQILKEPIFEKAFQTAEFAKFSRAQRDAYEQSVMDYIGVREVAVTAREELRQEMVIEMYLDGIEIERIVKIAKMNIAEVKAIIEAYLRKQERKG
jgi:3-dehydroquinate dehydratase